MRHDESYDYPDWREKLPAILTPLDVMDILGVGKNTVYNLLASGQLKGFRIGKRCA